MSRMRVLLPALALAVLATTGIAQISFSEVADGTQENPANASTAVGVAFLHLDAANMLHCRVVHNVANPTAAHIHRAAAGANGGIVFGFTSPASPITQTFGPLTAGEVTDLTSGLNYINIHSGTFPGGEIRAQIVNPFQGQIFINEYCNDPQGNGNNLDPNLDGTSDFSDDEFVEIVNGTGATVDLGGFTLEDGVAVRHTFLPGTLVQPGGAVVVFGGGDVTNFNAAGMAGVIADGGQLGLNNGGDTITLRDAGMAIVDTTTYASGGMGDGDGFSVVRCPETPAGVFDDHRNAPSGALHSAGRYKDDIHLYIPATLPAPPGPKYIGNGSDVDQVIRINGAVSSPATNCHVVNGGDGMSIQYRSPGGTLAAAPFVSFLQIFTTGSPPGQIQLPGDPMPTFPFSMALPAVLLFDGLSNPGAVGSPILDFTQVAFVMPAFLAGTSSSITAVCLVADAGINAVNLGVAETEQFDIP